MMLKIFFLMHIVAVGLADLGTMSTLAAPMQRTGAPNAHDGKLEVRDFGLVRRGRAAVKEVNLKLPRPAGHYVTGKHDFIFFTSSIPAELCLLCSATDCPYGNCGRKGLTTPGSMDRHLIPTHGGHIPAGWREPETVQPQVAGTGPGTRLRAFPLGENANSMAVTTKIATKYPEAAVNLQAQRKALGLFTAHMHVPPVVAQQVDPTEALRARLYQRRKALLADSAGLSVQQADPRVEFRRARKRAQKRALYERRKTEHAARHVSDPAGPCPRKVISDSPVATQPAAPRE